jgi:penicillin G amidase
MFNLRERVMGRWLAAAIVAATVPAPGADVAEVTMQVAGLKQPAEILVDQWGVPHIYARTFDDVFIAQGFNAARDRLFQIDLARRRGLGELAEVLGPGYVDQDRSARLFLYRGSMDQEWASYGANAKRMATAFVAGVNAYIDWLAANPDKMPEEFKLLGYSPARWNLTDVVLIRSHGLTRNLTSEVARANTVCKTDAANGLKYDEIRFGLQPPWTSKIPEGLDACLPSDLLRTFTLATQAVRIGRGGPASAALATEPDPSGYPSEGSNNWTIAPSRSATGRPILANDPHRAYSTPSLRYIAHLSAPGMDVIGAGEPAMPGIAIGHNGTIAFGITIFNIDQEDLYVYQLNPANPREYRYRQGWEPMRSIRETIKVKGAAPVDAELSFTRHGPVIFTDAAKGRAYALRSAWMEPGMLAYFGSVSYAAAKNYRQFETALPAAKAPTLNYVYADTSGNIAWHAAGLAPIRPNWDGLLPVPGDGRYEWAGFWPVEKLPSKHNPPTGYVSTSNEMNLPDGYPYQERKLSFEWTNGSRHARLEELFKSLPKVSIEDSMRMQTDITSIPARRLVALLAGLRSSDANASAALDLLRGWDGVERADSPQAALMEVWIARHLGKAFRAAVLPPNAAGAIAATDIAVMLAAMEKPETRFTSNPAAPASGKRDRLLMDSLGAAYLETTKLLGSDVKSWQWGKLHYSLPAHPMLPSLDGELRARLQPGPFPTSGGPYTPNQSNYGASDFRLTNGASFRVVLDVGNWDNSRAVNYPGQSGNPADLHYRDLAQTWLRGEYFPLVYSRAAVETATRTRIQLMPAKR